jgi:ribosomal protein S7
MNLNVYNKLIGFLTKEGKKNRAKQIVDKVLFFLIKTTKNSFFYIFFKFFSKLSISVEAKILKIRKSKFVVPFGIGLKRKIYLILKWLIQTVLENKKKKPLYKKISEEILSVLQDNKNSKLFALKKSNNEACIKNRSNLHYRW